MSEPFPILIWHFAAHKSTVIFTFLPFFCFPRRRHLDFPFPSFHGVNMPDIFTNRKPHRTYYCKIICRYFYFLIDRISPLAYSLLMALTPAEGPRMFQTLLFCRSTGRRLMASFQRILKASKPNGSTKIALEISVPLFLKITIEHSFPNERKP